MTLQHQKSRGDDAEEDEEQLRVFVISLCDGIGGAIVAVTARTCNVKGFIAEKEDNLRDSVLGKRPKFQGVAMVEDVDIKVLVKLVDEAKPDTVMLIMGPPCQPFSKLSTAPQGFHDPRSLHSHCSLQSATDWSSM